ncbi:MAG: hypothetical protein ACTSVA_03365 [Candidatus Njordarchaeales archaeon]
MKKIEQIIFLRDKLGLSWWQIGKIVYPEMEPSKAALKAYGYYKWYKERTISSIQTISSAVQVTDELYVKSKLREEYEPLFIGDLRKKRIALARQLKYAKDRERDRIYREINRIKLLELLIIIYDSIGLSRYDYERMWLMTIYSVGRKLVKRIDLSKDRVKWSRRGIDHLSEEAAAFLYAVYFVVLYNTRYQRLLEKIREIIYGLMRGRSRERKIRKIHEIMKEKFADVLADVILKIP